MNNNFNRRRNGTGTVVFLGKGRYKPYAPRLLVGKDESGKPIYFDIFLLGFYGQAYPVVP